MTQKLKSRSSSLSTLSLPPTIQNSLMTSPGASAGKLLGPGVVLLLHINIWLADYTRQSNVLSNERWQLQRKASNTFSAGPAGPCNLAVMRYSAEISLTKKKLFSFWNYEKNMKRKYERKYGIKMRSDKNVCHFEKNYIYTLFRFWKGQQRRPCWPWRPTTTDMYRIQYASAKATLCSRDDNVPGGISIAL